MLIQEMIETKVTRDSKFREIDQIEILHIR